MFPSQRRDVSQERNARPRVGASNCARFEKGSPSLTVPKPLPALPKNRVYYEQKSLYHSADDRNVSTPFTRRPESRADAFLVLEDEPSGVTSLPSKLASHGIQSPHTIQNANIRTRLVNKGIGPSRTRRRGTDNQKTAVATQNSNSVGSSSVSYNLAEKTHRSGLGIAKISDDQLDHSSKTSKGRRKSKILPAIPQKPLTVFDKHLPLDKFQMHEDKTLRSHGFSASSSIETPSMSDRTTSSSFSSTGDDMRNEGVISESRKMRLLRLRREEREAQSAPILERIDGDDIQPLTAQVALRPLSRCPSAFSIVIQPSDYSHMESPSQETPVVSPGLHVTEDDMPLRIKRILQKRGDLGNCSSDLPSSTAFPRVSSYHEDLALTIKTLRNPLDGDLEDIMFGGEDV